MPDFLNSLRLYFQCICIFAYLSINLFNYKREKDHEIQDSNQKEIVSVKKFIQHNLRFEANQFGQGMPGSVV